MPTKPRAAHNTRSRAKEVAGSGSNIRERVRDLALSAFRDRDLSMSDIPALVHDILEGAAEGVKVSIPESQTNVLRQVFDGLSDGVHAIASAGVAVARDVRSRGKDIAHKALPAAAKQVRAAQDDFLNAVKSFANRASKEVRAELDSLVARAHRTTSKVADSARESAHAADGRLVELSGETARAGLNIVRRAAGGLAMAAGGLLEGIAEAITPKAPRPMPSKTAVGKKSSTKKTAKKPAKGTKKSASKKR